MKAQMEEQVNVKTIKERLVSAEEQTAHKIHDLGTKAALVGSRAQVGLLRATGRTREAIHRRPLTSVLAGVGAGCLIGGVAGLIVGSRRSQTNGVKRSRYEQGQD